MRIFIGIDFSNEIKQEIATVQEQLKPYTVSGNWKPSESFHMTLKFLGEVGAAQITPIHEAIKNACMSKKPFELNLSRLWSFDGKDSIRILWLGLGGELDQLQILQAKIDSALHALGFPAEKRGFAPHVTIGQDIVFKTSLEQVQNELGDIELKTHLVKSLVLFESHEFEGKRIYTKIEDYALA
ncbi:MAG: RNA 2',3'-cyclic phosphodiesterase [Eubacteriales bacterium]|nr:RNA 2',3'-cyclic phosphodiesterase [Eubacteriales bacterium]